jgi:hypothetical protein
MTHLAWTESICSNGMDLLVAVALLSLRHLALPLTSPEYHHRRAYPHPHQAGHR